MSKDHKGFLLVLMQPPPAMEEEFNAWYDSEHLPERLAVAGFHTALRFVCLDGFPRYLAMYDLERPEVLETKAYLEVAYDRSSPWTKRVTSRVKIYRSSGRQIFPGHLITVVASRVTLLRFRACDATAEGEILAGLKSTFEGQPGVKQVRLLANDTSKGIDFIGFAEMSVPPSRGIDPKAFGRHAASLDMVNTYAPY